MKIRPKILSLLDTRKDIFFGREGFNSRRVYKALNNGNTDDWIYGDNYYLNKYTTEYGEKASNPNWISGYSIFNHSYANRIGDPINEYTPHTLRKEWFSNLLTRAEETRNEYWNDEKGLEHTKSDLINAAKTFKSSYPNGTLKDFLKWYNDQIKNWYDYRYNHTGNWYLTSNEIGELNKSHEILYPGINSKGYLDYSKNLESTYGRTTARRPLNITNEDVIIDWNDVDEEIKGLLTGVVKDKTAFIKVKKEAEPETPTTEPKTPTTEPKTPAKKSGSILDNGFLKQINTKPNRTALIFSNLAPELISAGRLWNTIRANNKVYKTLLNALHPTLHNTYERYSPVTGAFNVMLAYNQQAADVNRLADRNATADASLNLAARLDANKQANQYRMLGFLADDLQIQKTALAALERLEDNMARRSLVANDNMDSIINTNFNRALLKALRILSNYDAVNTFLKEKETDIRTKQLERKDIYEKINENILSNKLYTGKLELLAKWLENHPGDNTYYKAMQNKDFVKAIREYTNILTNQAYKNLLYNSYPNLKGKTEEEFWKNPFLRQGGVLSLQHGGNPFASFFVQYEPAERPSSKTKESSSKKDKSKEEISDKDFTDLMKSAFGKMLPIDAGGVMDHIQEILSSGFLDTSDAISAYGMILNEINDASFNKEYFDKVRTKAEKDNALYEPAITSDGRVVVLNVDDHSVEVLSLNEYFENKNNYVPLTNSMLLNLRANHPNYINNNNILGIVESGVNLTNVYSKIQQSLLKIASNTIELNLPKGMSEGAALLLNLSQYDPTLYNEIIVGLNNGSNLNQVLMKYADGNKILSAISYVWGTLNNNDKARLLLETKTGDQSDIIKPIIGYVISGIETSYKQTDLTLSNKESSGSSKSSGSSNLDNLKDTSAWNLLNGWGNTEILVINSGSNNTIYTLATRVGLEDENHNRFGTLTSFDDAVYKTHISSITDLNNITVGSKHIDSTQASKGVIIRDAYAYSVEYPCDSEGHPLIDPDTVKKKEEADKEINKEVKSQNIDMEKPEDAKKYQDLVNEIYEKYGLNKKYNENGEIDERYYNKYVVFNVYVNDKVIDNDIFDKNPYMQEVSKKDKDIIEKEFEDKPGGALWWKDKIWYNTMWIPMNKNYIGSVSGNIGSMSELNKKQKEAEVDVNLIPVVPITLNK